MEIYPSPNFERVITQIRSFPRRNNFLLLRCPLLTIPTKVVNNDCLSRVSVYKMSVISCKGGRYKTALGLYYFANRKGTSYFFSKEEFWRRNFLG